MSSPFENASERLSALMERASGLLEDIEEQRRNAAVQAEQSRKVNILSLAIAALSLVFAIAAVLAPYIWPQP